MLRQEPSHFQHRWLFNSCSEIEVRLLSSSNAHLCMRCFCSMTSDTSLVFALHHEFLSITTRLNKDVIVSSFSLGLICSAAHKSWMISTSWFSMLLVAVVQLNWSVLTTKWILLLVRIEVLDLWSLNILIDKWFMQLDFRGTNSYGCHRSERRWVLWGSSQCIKLILYHSFRHRSHAWISRGVSWLSFFYFSDGVSYLFGLNLQEWEVVLDSRLRIINKHHYELAQFLISRVIDHLI